MKTKKASCVSKAMCTSAKADTECKHQSAQSLSHNNHKKALFFFLLFLELSKDPFKEERKILIFKHCNIKG